MSWHVLRCAQQDECSNNQNWEIPEYYQLQEVDLLQPLLTILLEIELWGRPVHLGQVCCTYFHDDDKAMAIKKTKMTMTTAAMMMITMSDDTDAFSCLQVWISMSNASLECKFILVLTLEEKSL